MKKKMKSLVAAFAAVAIVLGSMPSVAMADDNYTAATQTGKSSSLTDNASVTNAAQFGADATAGKAVFTKSLKIENEADIPDVSFSYKIETPDGSTDNTLTADDRTKYVYKADGNSSAVSILRGINAGNIGVKGYYYDNTVVADDQAAEYAFGTDNSLAHTNAVATPSVTAAPVYDGTTTFNIVYANQVVNRSTNTSTNAVTVDDFSSTNYAATDNGKNVNIAHPFNNTAEQTAVGTTTAPTADNTEFYLANKSVVLDFSNIVYSEPGIYRYYLSETKGNEAFIKYDDKTDGNDGETDATASWRTLDVYVEDTNPADTTANAKDIKVTGYVLYNGKLTDGAVNTSTLTPGTNYNAGVNGTTSWLTNGAEVSGSTKSTGFLNEYLTSNLSIGKKVEGNQGAKDKYFKFTVAFTGLVPNQYVVLSKMTTKTSIQKATDAVVGTATKYTIATITGSDTATQGTYDGNNVDVDATYDGQQFQADNDGKLTVSLYLRAADYATFTGLPVGAKYTIEEDNEDYTTVSKFDYAGSTVDTTTYTGLDNMVAYVTNNTVRETSLTEDDQTIAQTNVTADDAEYAFVNTKAGVIPTGIIMSVAPAVVVGLGVLAAIFGLVLAGKKKELDEE